MVSVFPRPTLYYITTMDRKAWDEADMLNAHEAANINNASISAEVKEYGVPRMTLSDRVKGKVPMDAKMGRTNQHITVLCCINAGGGHAPPLLIFSKGMPKGRTYKKDGPPKATYSSPESGCVDREIYTECFQKNVLAHAS